MRKKFGRLQPTAYLGVSPKNIPVWACACSCGRSVVVSSKELLNGDTKSCGCLHKEMLRLRNKEAADPWLREHKYTYSSYISARRRALEPADKDYGRYGAVGVDFHAPWAKDFRLFVAQVGKRPLGCTLDRIDSTRGYVPGNVRWATPREQAANRRSTVWVELHGCRMPLIEAARRLGVTDGAVRQRLKNKGTLNGYYPRRNGEKNNKKDA